MAKKKTTKKSTKSSKKPKTQNSHTMKCSSSSNCGGGGALYAVGFIGALVYYLSVSTGFWSGVLAILKSLVWPAFLVFELLKYLGA